jgi:hypothetical protein
MTHDVKGFLNSEPFHQWAYLWDYSDDDADDFDDNYRPSADDGYTYGSDIVPSVDPKLDGDLNNRDPFFGPGMDDDNMKNKYEIKRQISTQSKYTNIVVSINDIILIVVVLCGFLILLFLTLWNFNNYFKRVFRKSSYETKRINHETNEASYNSITNVSSH